MMKTNIILYFFAAFSLLFVGCGGDKNTTDGSEEASSQDEATDQVAEVMDMEPGSASVLSNDDIDRFIKSYKPMSEDLEALGKSLNTGTVDPSLQAVYESQEVLDIVKKYGWDKYFGRKYMAISIGTSVLTMEEQVNSMPEDQRAAYKDMISTQWDSYSKMIHEDDLELLRGRFGEIVQAVAEE